MLFLPTGSGGFVVFWLCAVPCNTVVRVGDPVPDYASPWRNPRLVVQYSVVVTRVQ
jgi:hypothetical protein